MRSGASRSSTGSGPFPSLRGFTIVELLVVIGIAALMIALLFPALSAMRASGRQAVESNAARHLMAGYLNYAAIHKDVLLPGYGDWVPYRDGHPLSRPLRAFDKAGREISGGQLDIAKKRYVWRLAPFLSFELRGLYTNENQDLLEELQQKSHAEYLYLASLAPSLGLNSEWLGGEASGEAYGFLPPDSSLRDTVDFNQYYITSVSQARNPMKLLVFASARGQDPLNGGSQIVQGYYKVMSPYFSAVGGLRWAEEFEPGAPPVEYGYLSPRHGGSACVGFLDGHTGPLTKSQLKDMRHWANWADAPDWRLPLLTP
jgi:prepilin-type processing-associated H-X9-DG protein